MRWIELDYGQIEARVLGMASKDVIYCEALRKDDEESDVHLIWAKKLVEVYPDILRLRGGRDGPLDVKAWRKLVKNEWTFPLFYGAGRKTVAGGTKIPEELLEVPILQFWKMFSGVKNWQVATQRFYNTHGYVEALTGTRTYAPLKFNKAINSGIQGTAADICTWAHTEVCRLARQREEEFLIPVNNVHDALWWRCEKAKMEYVVRTGTHVMLSATKRFAHFMNDVPLTVEAEVGPNLYEMKSVGVYSSATTQ